MIDTHAHTQTRARARGRGTPTETLITTQNPKRVRSNVSGTCMCNNKFKINCKMEAVTLRRYTVELGNKENRQKWSQESPKLSVAELIFKFSYGFHIITIL